MRGERRLGIKRRWIVEGGDLEREVVRAESRGISGLKAKGDRTW